jgi:hypothetical protein
VLAETRDIREEGRLTPHRAEEYRRTDQGKDKLQRLEAGVRTLGFAPQGLVGKAAGSISPAEVSVGSITLYRGGTQPVLNKCLLKGEDEKIGSLQVHHTFSPFWPVSARV